MAIRVGPDGRLGNGLCFAYAPPSLFVERSCVVEATHHRPEVKSSRRTNFENRQPCELALTGVNNGHIETLPRGRGRVGWS